MQQRDEADGARIFCPFLSPSLPLSLGGSWRSPGSARPALPPWWTRRSAGPISDRSIREKADYSWPGQRTPPQSGKSVGDPRSVKSENTTGQTGIDVLHVPQGEGLTSSLHHSKATPRLISAYIVVCPRLFNLIDERENDE